MSEIEIVNNETLERMRKNTQLSKITTIGKVFMLSELAQYRKLEHLSYFNSPMVISRGAHPFILRSLASIELCSCSYVSQDCLDLGLIAPNL